MIYRIMYRESKRERERSIFYVFGFAFWALNTKVDSPGASLKDSATLRNPCLSPSVSLRNTYMYVPSPSPQNIPHARTMPHT